MRRTSATGRLLEQRLSTFNRRLAAARGGDPAAVHQARVATRRLRAALPLVASGSSRRKLERPIRRLTRALGPVRELDVSLQLLRQLHEKGEVSDQALTPLRDSLLHDRRMMHAELVARIDRLDGRRLRRKMDAALARLEAAEADRPRARAWHLAAVRRRAARRAARLSGAIERASGIYLPDRLHDVRIAVKKLRYTLEMARPGATPRPGASGPVGFLRRVQDLLGRMHDLEILIVRTRALQSAANAPDLKVSGELDALVRQLETDCRTLHGHYMASRARLIDLCTRTIDAQARGARRRAA